MKTTTTKLKIMKYYIASVCMVLVLLITGIAMAQELSTPATIPGKLESGFADLMKNQPLSFRGNAFLFRGAISNFNSNLIEVTASVDNPIICPGTTVNLYAEGNGGISENYSFTWEADPFPNDFDPDAQNPSVTLYQTTTFTVEVTDGINTATDQVIVEVLPAPSVDIGDTIYACPWDSVLLTSNVIGQEYYWSNGARGSSTMIGSSGAAMDVKIITLEVVNEHECVGADTIVIIFDPQMCHFGITEHINSKDVALYPNPTNGICTISFDKVAEGTVELRIYNLVGQAIYENKFPAVKNGESFTHQLDLSDHPGGIYFVNLANNNKSFVGKVVVE